MKPSSVVVAGMSGMLLGVSFLACVASTDSADPENVAETKQAICADPPCGPVRPDPTTPPTHVKPPPTSEPFTCSGPAGKDDAGSSTHWKVDCDGDGYTHVDAGVCVCIQVKDNCIAPLLPTDSGPPCNGFSFVSTYACPPLFPYQRCNSYGACSCNAYPN